MMCDDSPKGLASHGAIAQRAILPGGVDGQRCVVAGGAGAVGAMMADLLRNAGGDVLVVDRDRGDITAMDERLRAEVEHADVVVLAVPEPVALAAIPAVAGALKPGGLLVDTLSVKTRVVAALEAHAAHLEVVSLNPMFAPAAGFDGRAVAAVVVHDGPRVRALLAAIGRRGAHVTELGADEHDRIAAATQALTHAAVLAFGLALDELGVPTSALATPPHATMLALLARIAQGAPATYWDVQAGNPHAPAARAALAAGLATLADAGRQEDFNALLERAHATLGADREAYAHLCADLFAVAGPDRRLPT
jgi:prephenate dehydrogenase